MENTIVKTFIYDKQVRAFFADNTKSVNDILCLNKDSNSTLKRMLGKTVSVISLMSATLKGDQRISLQITMTDPKYKVFADADASGNVRGYLNEALLEVPDHNLPLKHLIGSKGRIRVIKGAAMNQFSGVTDMPYANIVDDLAHYFIQSEQTQTYIKTNLVLGQDGSVLSSNALFAQLLPGAPSSLMDEIDNTVRTNQAFFNGFKGISRNNIENRLSALFKDVNVIEHSSVRFFCGCSKEMFYGMILSLSKDELNRAISKKESLETGCQICGRTYSFNYNEIKNSLT